MQRSWGSVLAEANREASERVSPRDPKDVRIEQLERRVRELEARLSDYSWEASARHAAMTGGTL